MKMYTTPEQTAKLIELGFEKPKGGISKRVSYFDDRLNRKCRYEISEFNYSVGELIEMLMKVIGVRISFDSMYGGRLHLIVKRLVGDKWNILYGKVGKELADLLVDAIVKLKEEVI